MAGYLTDYANNKVLDLVFGGTPFVAPGSLYIGLSKLSAGKLGAISEPAGGSYARVRVTNDLANFPSANGGSKANATTIGFPSPTSDWGLIQSVFIADSASGGNVLAIADLPTPKQILGNASAPSIAVGALYLSHT